METRAFIGIVLAAVAGCRARPHPTGALVLAPCRLASPGAAPVPARCGALRVPERWPGAEVTPPGGAETARTLQVRVAVVPALNGEPMADAVVFLPDGPGRAATEQLAGTAAAFERVRRERDLLLVDWRGSGEAGQLRCGGEVDPAALPLAEATAWAERCASGLALEPRVFGTAAAVRDLEAARAALGYERLTLVGVAYGSRLALAYARRFPDRVRGLVIAGAAPLEVAFGGDADTNARNALTAVANRCERDAACARALPGMREVLPGLVRVVAGGSGDREASLLRRGVWVALESSDTAARLPVLAHAAAGGKRAPLEAEALRLSLGAARAVAEPLRLTVLCSEDVPFFGPRIDTQGFLGASLRDRLEALCRVWPHLAVDASEKEPLTGETPALVLSGTADPVTPPRYGDLVAGRLRRTIHVVLRGLSHDLLGRGCVPDVVATFIERGGEGGLDTSCVREVTPPALPLELPPTP
jgi:pimeloyl-ACP methyl ester carboxylesterase